MTKGVGDIPQSTGPFDFIGNLLEKVFDFIRTFFPTMSKRMQALVFFILVMYFVTITSVIVWRVMYPPSPMLPPNDKPIDIVGIINAEGGSIPTSLGLTDVVGGDNFFVRKQFFGNTSFVYSWLLRLPPQDTTGDVMITVNRADAGDGSPGLYCEGKFKKSKLLHTRNVVLAIGRYAPTMELLVDDTVHTEGYRFEIPSIFSTIGYAQERGSTSPRRISPQAAESLLHQYSKSKDPAAQLNIRQTLAFSDDNVTLMLADSLKVAVLHNRKEDGARFASLLSAHGSLGEFTSVGKHRDRFDKTFYGKAVEFLHTGNDYQARNMSLFLRRLQDARSIVPLFAEFDHSGNPRGKELCLYVLEAFASNSNAYVRNKVKSWLGDKLKTESPGEVSKAIYRTLKVYQAPLNTEE